MLLARPGLDTLQPYSAEDRYWQIKLDANERPADLPAAIKALVTERLAATPFHRYPEINAQSLKTIIASSMGLSAANVLIGNGSNEILAGLCYAYGGVGRSIVYPSPSFSMYGIYAKMAGSRPVPVMLNSDFTLDADKMLAAAKEASARVIILCNPNNPTGLIMPPEQIEYIAANAKCLVVVDEAYYEFYGTSALGLLAKYPHLVVARTFSKAYGLAAARVGYLLAGEEVAATVGKVFLPYNVNALSLLAAEVVYQQRQEFASNLAETASERERLAAGLAAVPGTEVFPSQTNFILIRSSKAAALMAKLSLRGIGVRDFSTASRLENCIRITVGTPAENTALLEVVTK